MFKRPWIAFVLIALLLAACQPAMSSAPQMANESPAAAPMDRGYDEADSKYGAEESGAGGEYAEVERVVIMNANLEIVAMDPAAAMKTISEMANEMGGFVVSSNLFKTRTDQGQEVPEANITVRVPAERLTEAMDEIKALVENPDEDVLNENVSGEDVTQEYTDLQSRLRNQEQAAEQLREILAEANRTEDVLSVYNELSRVTEQIEILKGKIQYFDESARLSAISVRIRSEESVAPLSIGGWKPVGTARDATQALIDALKFLANAAIWVVVFCLPIGLLLGVPAFFIIRGFLRWRARRRAARAAVKEEAESQAIS